MKIRNGFVSNSSSSSFVLSLKDYENTAEIACAMIPLREWDTDKELLKKAKELVKAGYDSPIAFRTCNYDTYISREKDGFHVYTCHNHPFSEIFTSIKEYDGDSWLEEETVKSSNKYHWLDYDVDGTPLTYEQSSKYDVRAACECYMDLMRDGEKIFCPKCGKVYHDAGKTELSQEQEGRLVKFYILLHRAMNECEVKSFASGDSDGNDYVLLREGISINADVMKCENAQQLIEASRSFVL